MKLPLEVQNVIHSLQKHGFEAYAVGGSVRDFLMGREPKDWDVTTNAKPEEIQKVFPDSFYTNKFGTVVVKIKNEKIKRKNDNEKLKNDQIQKPLINEIEVTTYRVEEDYSDKRHPDTVKFTSSLEEDLARRDFTINAMAFDGEKIVDLFGGQEDLKNKIIRTVRDPRERFNEDALRLARAVRFAVALGFEIENETKQAIQANAGLIQKISWERIRDEFEKIIMSPAPHEGIELLRELGMLQYIIPELEIAVGVEQAKHHTLTVYEHLVSSLKFSAERNYAFNIRLAALFHDIGKPQTKQGTGEASTFYGHEYVGAKITRNILKRLRFPEEVVQNVSHLVKNHLFYYNVGEVTESAVRRLLKKVGPENIDDLIKVRVCDRLGSGVPKAIPYRLRHLMFMFEKVSKDPISTKMLAINGNDVMKILNIPPSPKIGAIMDALLAEVIEDPKLNTKEYLEKRIKELNEMDLEDIRKKAKDVIEEKREEDEKGIMDKYKV